MADFSVFDLVSVTQGSTPAEALRRSLELAQKAETWGYRRFWVAEHHSMPGVASSATAVVISYLAGGTRTIRVGSGGIMLPNHSPLVIAEQFGTLETLYPGRIDLGVGRGPGTDQRTLLALRRPIGSLDQFSQDVMELQTFLAPHLPGQAVQAVPGAGTNVPLWILGSSWFGAQLAAQLGLPFAFAAHLFPKELMKALSLYRSQFQLTGKLKQPQAMVCVNVIAAETDKEAQRLFTSIQQSITHIFSVRKAQLPPPIDDIESYWRAAEKAEASAWLARSFVGSPETVQKGLKAFIKETEVDEVMVHSAIYDHSARLRSYGILSQVMREL
jgi:luciferase family oxidoreductase group 1